MRAREENCSENISIENFSSTFFSSLWKVLDGEGLDFNIILVNFYEKSLKIYIKDIFQLKKEGSYNNEEIMSLTWCTWTIEFCFWHDENLKRL